MHRSFAFAICSAMLLLASCEDEASSAPETSPFPARREISAALRASCPDLSAARAADGTTGAPVQLEQNAVQHVTYGIYDSTGALVTLGAMDMTVPSGTVGYAPRILWNGKDAAGNMVPTGHYFVFVEVRDDAGTLVASSSTCIGMISNA